MEENKWHNPREIKLFFFDVIVMYLDALSIARPTIVAIIIKNG